MTTALATIGRMPNDEQKRKVGRPSGKTPKTIIHTAIDIRVGRALRAYIESFEYPPKLKHVTERAFRLLLKEAGWPIEGDTPTKKPRKAD